MAPWRTCGNTTGNANRPGARRNCFTKPKRPIKTSSDATSERRFTESLRVCHPPRGLRDLMGDAKFNGNKPVQIPQIPQGVIGNTQEAPFPADSILADYHDYVITQSEGDDCYIIGSILPITAA